MSFDPDLALIRFGTGLHPAQTGPMDRDALMASIVSEDALALDFPIPGYAQAEPSLAALNFINRVEREARDTPAAAAGTEARRILRDQVGPAQSQHLLATLARAVAAPIGLRERLTAFWADHFTVTWRRFDARHLVEPYVADAIRPHVAGSFRDMLRAVVTHPMMLLYLEQTLSVGPNSVRGQRRGQGLNENLARELLELHLVGVDGIYTQNDVRQLAELLTGLSYNTRRGVFFDPDRAEPGGEDVLGLQFGDDASLGNVLDALDQLAVLPQTALHLARKLAVHFIGPQPPGDMIDAMVEAFGPAGDLFAMTDAMVTHPAAFSPNKAKVRQPIEFIVAGLRAIGVSGEDVMAFSDADIRRLITRPIQVMGQPWKRPPGPDGWPEAATDWIIPQAMAARISWAMFAPTRILGTLPDPREFAITALGSTLPEEVAFAASAAENRKEGVGVVLASAAFQRR